MINLFINRNAIVHMDHVERIWINKKTRRKAAFLYIEIAAISF